MKELELTKVRIHSLQRDINEILPNEVRCKLEQLVDEMDNLYQELEDKKPSRYYYRRWCLEQAQRWYYHLLSNNRD